MMFTYELIEMVSILMIAVAVLGAFILKLRTYKIEEKLYAQTEKMNEEAINTIEMIKPFMKKYEKLMEKTFEELDDYSDEEDEA